MFCSPSDALLRFAAWVNGLLYRERAQTLSEYALLISLVGVGATVLALISFREQLPFGYNSVLDCLSGSCGP